MDWNNCSRDSSIRVVRSLSASLVLILANVVSSAAFAQVVQADRQTLQLADNFRIPSFLSPVSYNSGGLGLMALAIADLNGDGKPDIVVANWCSNGDNCNLYAWGGSGSVTVLLGDGHGGFHPSAVYDTGGANAVSVAIADVNGDGIPDLVVANQCADGTNCEAGGSVGVLLGNGDGSFQPAKAYDSGGYLTQALAVGDLNDDGKLDIAVANFCQTNTCNGMLSVGVLLGNGDGTFQSPVHYSPGSNGAKSVSVKDVNGDGKLDLLVVAGEHVGVLLGNGDGSFQPVVTYDTGAVSPVSVLSADVNGDGKPDLLIGHAITCYYGGNCLSGPVGVLLGNGDGTFKHAVSYDVPTAFPIASYSIPVAVTDLNGDGKSDIVVGSGNSDNFGLLLGKGDGTFDSAVIYGSGAGYPAATGAVSDLNGDGKPDIVIGHYFTTSGLEGLVTVLLNNTPFCAPVAIETVPFHENRKTLGDRRCPPK